MKHLIPFTKDQLQIVQASLQLSLKYADSQYIDNVDEIMREIEETILSLTSTTQVGSTNENIYHSRKIRRLC